MSVFFVYKKIQKIPVKLINYPVTANSFDNKKRFTFTKSKSNLSLKQNIFVYEPFQNLNLKFYDENNQEIGKIVDFESLKKRFLFLNRQKSVYNNNQNILSSRFFNQNDEIKWNDELTFNITYDNNNYPLTVRYFNNDGTVNWQNNKTLDTIYDANRNLLQSRHFTAEKKIDWEHQNSYDAIYDEFNGRISSKKMFNFDGTVNWLHPDTFERAFNSQGFRIKERHFNSDATINWTHTETFDIQRNSENQFIKIIYFNIDGKPLK
ncbi:hypothetical protein [Candidatus Phytoplasma solani]|uniref:hypothetical protein n=1 Tax=Candidatus Phytoplasma solani TaxID=69896 RepID=UPI0032DB3BC4